MSQTDPDRGPGQAGEPETEARETSTLLGFVTAGAWKLATGAPKFALDLAHQGLGEAERLALSTLRRRMEAVAEPDAPPSAAAGETPRAAPARATAGEPSSAAELLAHLLDQSMEQTQEEARERLALRTLRQLLPDEVRILAALADGHETALAHLGAGTLVGGVTQRWMENLSPVGKEAGARLTEAVPQYLTHLMSLGLVEVGEEDRGLQLKYQLIEADTGVRNTWAAIEKAGLRPRLLRRTLRMSEAGRQFWALCQPEERPGWER